MYFSNFSDKVVSQVLDELGLQLDGQLMHLPESSGGLAGNSSKIAQPAAAAAVGDNDSGSSTANFDNLQDRLNNLRRD